MTKFISYKSLQTIKQFIPDLYRLGTQKIFSLAVLQLTSKDLKWAYHPNIPSIKSNKVNTTRLVVETMFQNHLVEWQSIRTRKFDVQEYEQYDCIDLHAAFYRRFYDDATDSKPEERKNIFVNCPNFSIQYFRYNNFLYREHLNKIMCIPHSKLPDLSPEIESMCMKLNIKLLPMLECTNESILKFIRNNYEGNILTNGLLNNHEFMTNPDSQFQPKEIMLFLDNDYSRRDTSRKVMFPEIETLLIQDSYVVHDQYKIDNRMTFIDLTNKKALDRNRGPSDHRKNKREKNRSKQGEGDGEGKANNSKGQQGLGG